MATPSAETVEAPHGEAMIEVKVRFWTNDLANGKGKVRPRHAWDSGEVRIKSNPSHGIKAQEALIFNSLSELPAKIEKVLLDHEVTLHMDKHTQKLYGD